MDLQRLWPARKVSSSGLALTRMVSVSEEQEEGEEQQGVDTQEDREDDFVLGTTKEDRGNLRDFPSSLPLAVG